MKIAVADTFIKAQEKPGCKRGLISGCTSATDKTIIFSYSSAIVIYVTQYEDEPLIYPTSANDKKIQ